MNYVTNELNNVDGDLRISVSEQAVVFIEPIFVSGIFNGKSGVFELTGSGEGIIHNNTATQYVSGSINTNKCLLVGCVCEYLQEISKAKKFYANAEITFYLVYKNEPSF